MNYHRACEVASQIVMALLKTNAHNILLTMPLRIILSPSDVDRLGIKEIHTKPTTFALITNIIIPPPLDFLQ